MNDAERRRKELLESARSLYSEKYNPPFIHPRYNNLCAEWSGKEQQTGSNGSFGLRVLLCSIILTAFVIADQKKLEIMNVDSKEIISAVEESDLTEVWKDL